MRIRHIENTLGSRRNGPMYASRDWVWRPQRYRRWGGAVPDVPSSDSRANVWPNISARIMIRCIDSTNGKPIFRVLEMTEIKTVPYVRLSHPFVERLIGTVRREYLDRTLFWTTA